MSQNVPRMAFAGPVTAKRRRRINWSMERSVSWSVSIVCGSRRRTGVISMGSTADKASGLANEAIGKAKQGIGSAIGSDKLKGEGAAQEVEGAAQKAVGDAKAAVKDGANKVADALNKKF